MGMSVHNNGRVNRAVCGVRRRDPPPPLPSQRRVPGVNRMTEVTISEQMTRMTRRAIAIPFQFLCGGLLPTSSCRERDTDRRRKDTVRNSKKTIAGASRSAVYGERTRTKRKKRIEKNNVCDARKEQERNMYLKRLGIKRITASVHGKLVKRKRCGCQSRTNVSQSRSLSALKETSQQQQQQQEEGENP